MHYSRTNAEVIAEGRWDEKSCVRRAGCYDIDKTKLPTGMKYLPKGTVLSFDSSTGKVAPCKTVVVHANAAKDATSLQVEKGHILLGTETIFGSTISAIDTSNTGYDVLTVTALAKAVTKGDVLSEAATNVIGLNYATVKIDDFPTCTPTLQAYEIEEDSLPYPVNDDIKAALTARHAWKV